MAMMNSGTSCFQRRISLVLAGLAVSMLSGCQFGQKAPTRQVKVEGPIRAIWVTRWDFKTPQDIAKVMDKIGRAHV